MKKSRLFFLLVLAVIGITAVCYAHELSDISFAEIPLLHAEDQDTIGSVSKKQKYQESDTVLTDFILENQAGSLRIASIGRRLLPGATVKTPQNIFLELSSIHEFTSGTYRIHNELIPFITVFISDTTPSRDGPSAA